ncbi:MAG: phospho-N-acetylmuramoyl-pentapeptide-transferase [Flavobacteriaceae bacterium]|nr:phospho-N-acetylmuramoyl-pentapeptide-transferase [Flavobacteriaceae bacterium]|tara:strand:- start:23530 stop:24756 length:1227 start_codon:yes stop_codon:yes gene_type:complete
MLYYLFEYLENEFQLPGATLFQFLSFRSAFAILISLLFTLIFGRNIINFLKEKQVGESIRDLGLSGQKEKEGTPSMGGIIIILGTLIPVFLLAKIYNIYIILLIITTLWTGMIGIIDDYIKIFRNKKSGLKGKFKIIGQILLGIFIGCTMYFNDDIKVKTSSNKIIKQNNYTGKIISIEKNDKAMVTTIPFLKNNEFNYNSILETFGVNNPKLVWIIFIPIIIFIISAVSNGANLTDGIDGLAAGTSAIIVFTLGIFAWVSGNIKFADYLNIMYIPDIGEISIFISAFLGSLIGFLWHNTYPASVFMGDTGSLTIGALISVIAIIVRKELLIPLLCGVFLIEIFSVIIQVTYFKYTKKKSGNGLRVFKMSPIHHHFQKLGYHESKIVSRFWIIGILLAVLTVVTLKLR